MNQTDHTLKQAGLVEQKTIVNNATMEIIIMVMVALPLVKLKMLGNV
jgi:hypothetical protein